MKKLIEEFKSFAFKGNVLDMAVGIMIGGAITSIVSSLVNDILMPVISIFTGKIDFTNLVFKLGTGDMSATIKYGNFITYIINFLLMALCIFIVLKIIVKLKKPEVKKEARKCPYCYGEIHDDAVRCPHCTSELEKAEETEA